MKMRTNTSNMVDERFFDCIDSLGDSGIYSFVNPSSYLKLSKEKFNFRLIDGFGVDGISGVYLLKIFCGMSIGRSSFDFGSLAKIFFQRCSERKKSVVLIGAKGDEILRAKNAILDLIPGLNVVYTRDGYFTDDRDRSDLILHLKHINPDIIIVGMGAVLQEKFLVDLKASGWTGLGITCGGFFHQLAKRSNYYPKIFNRLNLRFLVRIYDEPKLIRRYAFEYPVGMIALVRGVGRGII